MSPWATSKPSIRSSPWIRDAPHFGFSLLIRRMRSRRPRSIFGRPSLFRDFQRQNGGFQEVDLAIAGDGEASLPALTEAVKRLIDEGRNPLTRSQ